MKKIIFTILSFIMISSCDLIRDSYFEDKATGFDLYYCDITSSEWDGPEQINNEYDLAAWITHNIACEYDEHDYWKSPEETLNSKKGDCEDISLLFIDLAYFYLGERYNLVLVDYYDMSKTIVDGGNINHAAVEKDGAVYEISWHSWVECSEIGYIYSFEEIFNL